MNKYITMISAIATTIIGTQVFAGGPDEVTGVIPDKGNHTGFYIAGQVGFSDVYAHKFSKGPTVNGDPVGYENIDTPTTLSGAKKNGAAGRISVGDDLNQYFGLETGFAIYPSFKRTISGHYVNDPDGIGRVVSNVYGQARANPYVFDLLAKATLPMDNFFLFGKAGAALVHTSNNALNYTASYQGVEKSHFNNQVWAKGTNNRIRPELVVGLGYNISKKVALNGSYSYIFGQGQINQRSYMPNMDMAALGLIYNF